MPVSKEVVKEVRAEMSRLSERLDDIETKWKEDTGREYSWHHPRESGAVKRASMDLTRSLAKLRKSA